MSVFPVYVATRGRPHTSSTLVQLAAAGDTVADWLAVLEPHETAAYGLPAAHTLPLPDSHRGLAYVRQFILDHARRRGLDWFWMLDDDIAHLYGVSHGRTVPLPVAAALGVAQGFFVHREDVAQAGLEYQQFAWSARRPVALNSYCDVAVAIHARRTQGVNFRPALSLKVDRDFTLQVLASGYKTVKIARVAFAAPANGSNAGGLSAVYATADAEARESRLMEQLWGRAICTAETKPNGRPDVKIHWKFFAP